MQHHFSVICFLLLACTSHAFADGLPEIRAGLWQVENRVDGDLALSAKQCHDSATFKRSLTAANEMMGSACSDIKLERKGNAYHSRIECNFGGSTMVVDSVLTGDYKTMYSVVTKSSYTPPLMGMSSSDSVISAEYIGACEQGMRPGEMITSDGTKMNMFSLMDDGLDLGKEIQKLDLSR